MELDAFSTVRTSPTAEALKALEARDSAVDNALRIEARLAPVEAEVASITSRIDLIEKTWATAVADKKDDGALSTERHEQRRSVAASTRERAMPR